MYLTHPVTHVPTGQVRLRGVTRPPRVSGKNQTLLVQIIGTGLRECVTSKTQDSGNGGTSGISSLPFSRLVPRPPAGSPRAKWLMVGPRDPVEAKRLTTLYSIESFRNISYFSLRSFMKHYTMCSYNQKKRRRPL